MIRRKPPTAAEARALANQVLPDLCPTPLEKFQQIAEELKLVAETFRLDIDDSVAVPPERIVDDLRDLLEELS